MKYDPSSGKPFYVNHATKATQWEPPTNNALSTGKRMTTEEMLLAGWETKYDPATGKPFYINHTAKTTQWDPPTAPPVAAAAAAVQQHQQHLNQQQLVVASQVWQPQNYTQMTVQNYQGLV